MTTDQRLQSISDLCSVLGADARYQPEYRHLVVLAWEHEGEQRALFIQRQIQRQAEDDPRVVCSCFDPFRTLIYTI